MKLVIFLDAQHAGAALYESLVVRDADRWALPCHIFAWRNCRDVMAMANLAASVLALVGGALVLVLGDGPHLPKASWW